MTQSTRPGSKSPARSRRGATGGTPEVLHVEAFEPEQVRPWRFHNRRGSGMEEESLEALALSIRRDGQQQLGLARRLTPGDTHLVEAIFGVRRLEACRRAGVPWRAEVREASFSDAECASLMHGENEWTEGVSAARERHAVAGHAGRRRVQEPISPGRRDRLPSRAGLAGTAQRAGCCSVRTGSRVSSGR